MSIVTLRDLAAGTSAKVLPEFGFNCYSFVANYAGRLAEVLWAAPGVESGRERPSGSGVPILFPFPGRIRGTSFEFRGATYEVPPGDAFGNAIHGFVLNQSWEVVEQSEQRVVGRIAGGNAECGMRSAESKQGDIESAIPHSEFRAPNSSWPAAYRLSAAWSLAGNSLSCEIDVQNPGDRPLPWGLGLHPYFRVPLLPYERAADCLVTVPAKRCYELADMIPSGATRPAVGRHALAVGKSFTDCQFDDVFTDLTYTPIAPEAPTLGLASNSPADGCGLECVTSIFNSASGCRLTVAFSNGFSHCVVYNPPHREAICIEPYTCAPGMFGQGGVAACEDVLAILPPGGAARLKMRISAE